MIRLPSAVDCTPACPPTCDSRGVTEPEIGVREREGVEVPERDVEEVDGTFSRSAMVVVRGEMKMRLQMRGGI